MGEDESDGEDDKDDHSEVAAEEIILKTGYHIDEVFVAIKCFEHGDADGPLIGFQIVHPRSSTQSKQWTITADPLKLGLQDGAWEAMPVDEKQSLCTLMLDEIRWNDEERSGVHFSFDEE